MARAYSDRPLPSCHALVQDGDLVLLIKRANEPFKGLWGIPGGGVELGETVAEALQREVREETGLAVEPERMLGYKDAIYRDPAGRIRYHYVVFYFLARPTGGRLQAASDAADARWVDYRDFGGLQVTDAVGQCLRWAGMIEEE